MNIFMCVSTWAGNRMQLLKSNYDDDQLYNH